ncbi:unnamed protein product [Nippostrongylus brasiliensis]|uniref:Ground-like domain-containing protein n=1 Tax=Nippostrongylus brasiliensis TaxID=27835 RepID=A0A0N4Y6W2_NIPBR|nr:hypothetical protein Q1695_007570 [Nippostrongylus brasiliensis]VDL75444.1 unnamed protein product [Nippostrongylus brasiliensis]
MWLLIFISLFLQVAVDAVGFGVIGGSSVPCGLQVPTLQFLAPLAPNPCIRRKRQADPSKQPSTGTDDKKCNSEQLRQIILSGIKKNLSQAKSAILLELQNKLGGNWVVMCAPEPVSFVTHSQQYCLDGLDGTWCYAFKID